MLGDEVGNKAIGVTVKASQITAKLVLEVIRSIANDKYKVVNGKQSLKELNKKGKALENVNIDKADLKAIQRQLKKDGIDFAIKKDSYNEVFNLYFKGQDISQIEKIFKEPVDYNVTTLEFVTDRLKTEIDQFLISKSHLSEKEIVNERYNRFRRM